MLTRWQALLRSSVQRLQSGERRLAALRRQWNACHCECERLQAEIALQDQLACAGYLDGSAVDRQQLFSWLRKTAADKRRTQALRLELRKQQELGDSYAAEVDGQQAACRKQSRKCESYEELIKAERRERKLRSLDLEENETEERISWSK